MADVDMSEPVAAAKGDRSPHSSRKASTTVSTRSSHRTASPSRASKQDDAGPPTPESPPFRLTRKRAASLADKRDSRDDAIVVDDNIITTPTFTHSRMSSGGASAGSAGSSAAAHVCLCQPDPKIPRPRNAFILYRQHHQAAIVAQHPGLANPDISKIIGEQWKAQSESVRNEWKALAEEEKLRHQQQYPEYRYQPRRGGRRGSLSSINTTTNPDKNHCSKCGGRSITTPTTPFSSHHPHHVVVTAAKAAPSSSSPTSTNALPMLPPPTPSSTLTPTSRFLPPMMSNLAINNGAGNNQQQRHSNTTTTAPASTTRPNPLTNLHAARTQRGGGDDIQMMSPLLSPGAKRRRYNQTYVPPPSSASSSSGAPRSSSIHQQPGTPYPFPPPDPRRHSLPRPDSMVSGGGSGGGSGGSRGVSPRSGGGSGRDGNLITLPPLQTAHQHHPYPSNRQPGTPAAAGAGEQPQSGGAGAGGSSSRSSVENIVVSMPFWGKIRMLGKIAPAHRGGGGGSGGGSARSPASPQSSTTTSAQKKGVRGALVAIEGDDGAAVKVLATWLEENLNKTGEVYARVAEAPRSPAEVEAEREERGVGLGEYVGVIAEWHGKTKEMVEFITSPPGGEPASSSASSPKEGEGEKDGSGDDEMDTTDKRTPVLLLPSYNLRAADAWASRIPIADNYSPADHWQWVATLWRGILGPDIVIYVRDVLRAELELGGRQVEVREDGQTRCLIVKRASGRDIEESALRRLGFEVGELIRSVSGLNGGG